jgi:hypothetical protein
MLNVGDDHRCRGKVSSAKRASKKRKSIRPVSFAETLISRGDNTSGNTGDNIAQILSSPPTQIRHKYHARTGFETKTAGDQESETSSTANSLASSSESSLASKETNHATNEGSSPATDFEALREAHVGPLMDLNDRINVLTMKETKINATRIVVAGDQSHGKTSLLEALCGINLPRGEGIQTRVPLILQLRRGNEEYAVISI